MTDMKTTFLGLLLLTATAISAQEQARTFQLADAPRYSEETGYGYDLAPTPEKGSKAPFFFSVRVPDGNYKVTVRLGSKKQAGVTTVRGESRRLFVDNLPTRKGQFTEETFIINKRNPRISDKESVRIKPREKTKLNWDDKLTLEFNGDAPVCQSISIEPADPSVITVFLCGSRSGQRALGQLGTNDSSLLRHRCLYRQLCRIRRIGKYLYRSQTTGEGFKPDQKRRLSLYGVRSQRPKAERAGQRSLLLLHDQSENIH